MSIVANLRKEIAAAQAKIEEVQKACTHPSAAVHRKSIQIPVTVHYEDEIGGQSGTDWRNGFSCSCGLCEKEWSEYADGRVWSPFDQEDIGRV